MSAVITQRDACLFLLFCSERDKLVFDIMDEDSNNKISYEEFFEPSQSVQKALARAESAGVRTALQLA